MEPTSPREPGDGRRRRTSFYFKTPDEEIGERLSSVRRPSIYSRQSSVGTKNSEVVMVPLLLNRTRLESDQEDVFGSQSGQQQYNVTYLDIMAMQAYGCPPSNRVVSVLKRRSDRDKLHYVFCEMETFTQEEKWKQTGRWVKYEECIEESGDRWSKPHVSMLSLISMFELRKSFLTGQVMLDMYAETYTDIVDQIINALIENNHLKEKDKSATHHILMCHHEHGIQNDQCSCSKLDFCKTRCRKRKKRDSEKDVEKKIEDVAPNHKFNQDFLRKIPIGCEALNILVGETDFLTEPITVFVRLKCAISLAEMPEVKIPTRFMYVLLGPCDPNDEFPEVGRSLGTVMSDEVFREIAYHAENRKELLAGIDEFMSHVSVLPPGKFDPEERIEPPYTPPCQKHRLNFGQSRYSLAEEPQDMSLRRTGRLFGGFVADIKRRYSYYRSDITDAISMQCVAAFIFMYIACLTPVVTIGGLLGSATENHMGAIEALVSAAICGTTWHLFSGQPLTIIGATGPVLVFEKIMYSFCQTYEINYLPFRFWTGIWVGIILIVIVMFDLSSLVRYITRFTEEGFAMLIAFIFIFEALKKLLHIMEEFPVDWYPDQPFYHDYTCFCSPQNGSLPFINITEDVARNMSIDPWVLTHYENIPVHKETGEHSHNNTAHSWDAISMNSCAQLNGSLTGPGCETPHYVADVFFFSCSLFLCTFVISIVLKTLRSSHYFPTAVRAFISDFAVPIAILTMTIIDNLVHIHTPKLTVPDEFRPTMAGRGWVINPLGNALWCIPAAIIPAIPAAILIFMDQQITAVIVNRREHKLMKGCGYHLDLLVIAIQIMICSAIGTPWFVAATMESINHVRSLSRESEVSVPGERPKFLGVREQRVTGFLAFAMIGTSAFLSMVLKFIPLPILYGVFFYMGITAMRNLQLYQRVKIMFMPPKYQPDYLYLRHVQLRRVYLFTLIQILCLAGLWLIKLDKTVSILFPLMVLALCFIRKAMDWIFTQHEMRWLDDILPDAEKKEQLEDLEMQSDLDYSNDGGKSFEMTDIGKKDTVINEQNGVRERKPSTDVRIDNKPGKIMDISEQEAFLTPEVKLDDSINDENHNKTKPSV